MNNTLPQVSDNISCPHQKTCNEAEAQDRQSKIRNCLRRIAEVEAINVDLESRLEAQAREYVELESDASESFDLRDTYHIVFEFLFD